MRINDYIDWIADFVNCCALCCSVEYAEKLHFCAQDLHFIGKLNALTVSNEAEKWLSTQTIRHTPVLWFGSGEEGSKNNFYGRTLQKCETAQRHHNFELSFGSWPQSCWALGLRVVQKCQELLRSSLSSQIQSQMALSWPSIKIDLRWEWWVKFGGLVKDG